MSFFKLSALALLFSNMHCIINAMDENQIEPILQVAHQPVGSLQEELNADQSRTSPAFPRHLFFDLGLRLDEETVKQVLQEQKKTFKSLNPECKTEKGTTFNRRLIQTRAAGHQDNSPIPPEDTVVVITMQICGHPVTISMPVDRRNMLIEQGLKVQLRRRMADITQRVSSFQQTHFETIRNNIKEFRKSASGVAILKTLPRTYLSVCQFIAKDLTEDLADSAQQAINSAEFKKNDLKMEAAKDEFERNIQVLRKLEPIAKNARLLNELKGTRNRLAQALKSQIGQDFCSSFEQYVQSQIER
jgi:hypothetical protein